MPAVWHSLLPAKDKRKALKETPIPSEHLSTVLPLWESISNLIDEAKKNIDMVSRELEREQPTSLACAGAASASLRVGKMVKCSKVRDLPKCKTAILAATTKVNLCWAGIETQKGNKAVQVRVRKQQCMIRLGFFFFYRGRLLAPALPFAPPFFVRSSLLTY